MNAPPSSATAHTRSGWMTTRRNCQPRRSDRARGTDTTVSAFLRALSAPEIPVRRLRRRLVVRGSDLSAEAAHAVSPDLVIPLPNARLGELCGALRARLAGRRLDADTVAGVPMDQVDALLETLRAARYGVLVWNAAELTFPHADLHPGHVDRSRTSTKHALVGLRSAQRRDTSAASLHLRGLPLRTAFGLRPHYHRCCSYAVSGNARGGACYDRRARSGTRAASAACRHRPLRTWLCRPAGLFIPVAVPGVHHAGFMHRMDGVVALPLQGHTPADLPSVAQALAAIQQEMNHVAT